MNQCLNNWFHMDYFLIQDDSYALHFMSYERLYEIILLPTMTWQNCYYAFN